ncbi:MAG: DUF3991 and toprim domain-containing protein [Saccharofermentanales bacterium]
MRVSKEQIKQARQIDLLTYMQKYNPANLKKVSKNEWSLINHDSLKISNGLWFWFSQNIGGRSALDYLIKVEGINFKEAVKHLNNIQGNFIPEDKSSKLNTENENKNRFIPDFVKEEKTEFVLPEKADTVKNVYAYLRLRGISANCINKCLKNKILFQDKKNNAVFVGYKENGKPGYAFKRGTCSDKPFWSEHKGSNKKYGFCIKGANSKELKIFEAAIDALSYYTLYSRNNSVNSHPHLLALGGVSGQSNKLPVALTYYLENNHIEKIGICFDNDEAGRAATKSIIPLLEELGYPVEDEHPLHGKDYNDYLLYQLEKKQEEYER